MAGQTPSANIVLAAGGVKKGVDEADAQFGRLGGSATKLSSTIDEKIPVQIRAARPPRCRSARVLISGPSPVLIGFEWCCVYSYAPVGFRGSA
jgi:hypothetical protein